jgi:GDPmannose 4,6-dehydratase
MKKALVTGITGQDGAYLTKNLISNGYEVLGLIRNNSNPGSKDKLKYLFGTEELPPEIKFEYSDMTDGGSVHRAVNDFAPDEVYNLAAQSHVGVSFKAPGSTAYINAIGVLNILEACRNSKANPKFYQASTSEMFGKVTEIPQVESTPFYPRSPYGVAKVFGYWLTVNYRESYDLFGCNGILFNHESPLRGEEFVTRKITKGAARIYLRQQDVLKLGNLDAKRDWGHAADYVEAMRLMLQQDTPDDYVVATGVQTSVRSFCEKVFTAMNLDLHWVGEGIEEVGYCNKLNQIVIRIDPQFYRPAEVDSLLGDATLAKEKLNWKIKYDIDALIEDMVNHDFYDAYL